ncbi:MAG: DNA repair protein [Sphingomonas sp.]|uniref:JAB domain-containing protein n=1 Tax=Sphingomonas sp. TaxID=28214 RepID=UPI001AC59E29|nr:JAB domain-containing protein [Sphingomonas sp.]MBN8807898.1 DNA repair protein [Sphingomonas sp.]
MPPAASSSRDLQWALDLFAPLARRSSEAAAFVYLDPKWRMVGMRHSASRDADSITVAIRTVMRDALSYDAHFLVMAHNHPSGDATPSRDDILFTRRLARVLDAIGVTLVDHLIVSANATSSFRQAGLL